jgi:hypothetical protein
MENTNLIVETLALIAAVSAFFITILRLIRKNKAENELEKIIHDQVNSNISDFNIRITNNICEISEYEKEKLFLDVVTSKLNKDDKDAIVKTYNKKNQIDQKRYFEKLIGDSHSKDLYKRVFAF